MFRTSLTKSAALLAILLPAAALAQSAAPTVRLEPSPCALMALRFIRQAAIPRLTKDLNLTDDQVNKITDILRQTEEAMKPKIEQQRQATKEFVLALADPASDEKKLNAAFEKVSKAECELAAESIKALIAIKNLLSQEQKAALSKILESRTRPWQGITVPSPVRTDDSAPANKDQQVGN
ncbi:MAG: Spy/CpxP family protein refolding chaperone [Armatimonadota bacterium]|nr:Spy/CpxP family protein refolding chaperone [Armatimonadota bacterium]